MLAFILLVVLGGGIGLLAVSLAQASKPATDGGPNHRAPDHDDEPGTDAAEPDPEAATEPDPEAGPETRPDAGPDGARSVEATDVLVPVGSATVSTNPVSGAGPVRRRRPDPRTVPRHHIAIEGRFDEVARPPWWRRLLSLVALVVIAVLVGTGLAAMAAGVIGAIAELVDAAVG